MHNQTNKQVKRFGLIALSLGLLFYLCACQSPITQTTPTPSATQRPLPTPTTPNLQIQNKPTLAPTTTPIPPQDTPTAPPANISPSTSTNKPVLAFYYPWYDASSWCSCKMSDLPTIQYKSADDTTINRQLTWAAEAGISGFISSWWGPGDATDQNFARLLDRAKTLEGQYQYRFASSIYFESDAPNLKGTDAMITALRYLLTTYSNSPYFFHWQSKPVFFFWNPLGNGRTLEQWASIRKQVDPNNQTIWSAEGVDTNILSVFDGLHLFSAGYWGIQNKNMAEVDQGFRTKLDEYNSAHQTQKIWAAGVAPGFDDSRLTDRSNHVVVARNNGATYTTSWLAAISSLPDWITITSFNEWFEGSMIEPSIAYNTQYLTLTKQFTQQWRK
jgi:hypothetical protein